MADDLHDLEFYLPSDFLTDDDILSDFSSLTDPGSTSPQSTLFGFEFDSTLGSPVNLKNDGATLDLLNKAAGEVEKMNNISSDQTTTYAFGNGGYETPPFYPPQSPSPSPSPFFYRHLPPGMMWEAVESAPPKQEQQKQQQKGVGAKKKKNKGSNRPLGLPPSAWPPLTGKLQSQPRTQAVRAMVFVPKKRESVGTGVFLPPLPNYVARESVDMDEGCEQGKSTEAKTKVEDIELPSEWVY